MPLNGNELLDLETLATRIAAALGDPWRAKAPSGHDHFHALAGPDGEELALTADPVARSAAGRVEIKGLYPQGFGGPVVCITVGAQRDPSALATDIQRRLLPGYRDALGRARAVEAKREAAEQARTEVVNRLLAALGVQGAAGHRPGLVAVGTDEGALVHGTAELCMANGSVAIDVTAPIETAEILLRICAALNAAHPSIPPFAAQI